MPNKPLHTPRPPRGASRVKAAQPQEDPNESKKKEDPWVPPEAEYEVAPPDPLQDLAARVLGIKEYPAQPATNLPPPTGWYQNIYQRIPRLSNVRSMEELRRRDGSTWRPARMMLRKRWQAEDPDPKWFENIYSHLYHRVSRFAGDYFGYEDLPGHAWWVTRVRKSVWLTGFSKEFKQYTEAVARQDNNVGGWDDLLFSQARRKYLVAGIIGRVLYDNVWESLLFGATEAQKKMLEGQDKLTVGLDGEYLLPLHFPISEPPPTPFSLPLTSNHPTSPN